ncbi:hypothetical protein Bca4012_082944 [Brassica carinata]|uniref:Uncharacterized protein n=1 Tax=Brassica carinata TaxID=52824 RepID=A0A8X7UPX8_BRACI|nr:hypothetical protein Bca52824_046151 [Brassica carinata]
MKQDQSPRRPKRGMCRPNLHPFPTIGESMRRVIRNAPDLTPSPSTAELENGELHRSPSRSHPEPPSRPNPKLHLFVFLGFASSESFKPNISGSHRY